MPSGRIRLTRLELEIMDLLWELEEASVRELIERMPERKRPAYTTVQTMIQRLEQKGAVRRTRKVGNALMFRPAITRRSVHQRLIDELLDLLGGSPEPLLSRLVETGKLSLEDLHVAEKLLSRTRKR